MSSLEPISSILFHRCEFEELEAVPSLSVMEGPLEPTSTTLTATDAPEDPSFENYFSMATTIGSNAPNASDLIQPYLSSASISLFSRAPIVVSSAAPASRAPSLTVSSSSTPIAIHDSLDPISSSNGVTNLVKPSFFSPPSSSSALMMPPLSLSVPTGAALNPPLSLLRPYGAPMLQPFPPPTPPPSLTPSSALPSIDVPLITTERVRNALLMLVQDDQFIDQFYQTLLKVHQS